MHAAGQQWATGVPGAHGLDLGRWPHGGVVGALVVEEFVYKTHRGQLESEAQHMFADNLFSGHCF